jgi:hypothetical protein
MKLGVRSLSTVGCKKIRKENLPIVNFILFVHLSINCILDNTFQMIF